MHRVLHWSSPVGLLLQEKPHIDQALVFPSYLGRQKSSIQLLPTAFSVFWTQCDFLVSAMEAMESMKHIGSKDKVSPMEPGYPIFPTKSIYCKQLFGWGNSVLSLHKTFHKGWQRDRWQRAISLWAWSEMELFCLLWKADDSQWAPFHWAIYWYSVKISRAL